MRNINDNSGKEIQIRTQIFMLSACKELSIQIKYDLRVLQL